jgi:uncharacterized protein YodC (DUF2158 family)
MAEQFKPGDLVMLKISNQKMNIKGIATKPSSHGLVIIEDTFVCVWVDGVKEQKGVFHKDALQAVAPYYDSLHFANYE